MVENGSWKMHAVQHTLKCRSCTCTRSLSFTAHVIKVNYPMWVVLPVHFWQLLWSWVVALNKSHRMWQWWVSNHGQSHSQSPWDKLGMRHQHYGEPEWTDNFSTTERFLLLWCYWKIGSKFKSEHPNGLVVWKGGVNWKEFPRVHTILHTYVWYAWFYSIAIYM